MTDCSTKICSRCKKELPLAQFYRCNDTSTGYRSACKLCLGWQGKHVPKTIRLKDGLGIVMAGDRIAVVDCCDADLGDMRWKPNRNKDGNTYAAKYDYYGDGRYVGMHRIILSRMLDRALDSSEEVDHIDNNTLNNRRSNLRLATRAQNSRNRLKAKHSTAPYKGITKYGNRWRARIESDGKRISLGVYATPEEAYAAYCKAAKEYHGEFARLE